MDGVHKRANTAKRPTESPGNGSRHEAFIEKSWIKGGLNSLDNLAYNAYLEGKIRNENAGSHAVNTCFRQDGLFACGGPSLNSLLTQEPLAAGPLSPGMVCLSVGEGL